MVVNGARRNAFPHRKAGQRKFLRFRMFGPDGRRKPRPLIPGDAPWIPSPHLALRVLPTFVVGAENDPLRGEVSGVEPGVASDATRPEREGIDGIVRRANEAICCSRRPR